MRFFIFITISFLFCSFNVWAANEELSQKQQSIIQRVLNGELNNSIHSEFWEDFSAKQREDIKSLLPQLVQFQKDALDWQKATWSSVRESFLRSTEVRTDEYKRLKLKIENGSMFPAKAIASAIENAEMAINLASKRQSVEINGNLITFDDKTAEQVLINLDSAFERIEHLFDPYWSFENEIASHENFATIISTQPTWQRRAAACLRYWDVPATIFELMFADAKREGNFKKQQRLKKSILNTKIRLYFIQDIITEYSLNEISERAYSLGKGVDFQSKNLPKEIGIYCGKEINNNLKKHTERASQATKKARDFLETL